MDGWKHWRKRLQERMPERFLDIRPETQEKFIKWGWLILAETLSLREALRRCHMSIHTLYKYENLKSWIEEQVSEWTGLLGDRKQLAWEMGFDLAWE